MSTHKHIDRICIGIVLFTLLLTVLFMNGQALGIALMESGDTDSGQFTKNDLNANWDATYATHITLTGDSATVQGGGAYVYDGDVYIRYPGTYVLSGELTDGSIIINADDNDNEKIWLLLDGVSLHCEDNAAILVEEADKVFLTLAEGSENFVSSGAEYNEEAVSAGVDGTIYSRDDLTINGSGSLSVEAKYQHGIVCNDDFVVTGGSIAVTATKDGIHANDSAKFANMDLTINAGDDGITVKNDDETSYIYIESGNINITSCYEGIEAIDITIAGGKIDIRPTDDGINACGQGRNSAIRITGGDITIINENGRDADGLDSNGDIYIGGGNLFVSLTDNGGNSAIDYGSENGGVCEISGGTFLACGSSSMAESFDSTSTQGFLMYNASVAAGTTVAVKDAAGNELLSESVPCSFSSILVSTPEMRVGDTCTLVIGENETEMTIDNASAGGFGGGKMPGGNGFGGGQKQGRGDFDRNGNDGMFGGRVNDQAQNGEIPQDSNDQLTQTVTPAANLLSTTGTENQNENMPNGTAPFGGQNRDPAPGDEGSSGAGGMQPPEMPDGMNGDDARPDFPQGGPNGDGERPDFPQGGMGGNNAQSGFPQGGTNGDGEQPDFSQDGMNGDGERSDVPQGDGEFGGRFDGNMGNMQGQDNSAQTKNAGVPFSTETLLLLGASALALLIGCVVAFAYKRRG